MPVLLGRTLANSSIDKPAEFTRLKLPSGTLFLAVCGTILDGPARFERDRLIGNAGEEEEYLAFGMGWDSAPTLLVTMQSFD